MTGPVSAASGIAGSKIGAWLVGSILCAIVFTSLNLLVHFGKE